MIRAVATLSILALLPIVAAAAPCPGKPATLGTERVLEVSAASTPRVGRKHFPATLPLGPKELVLTFDDGPWPETTPAVLDALARECVRASFFMLGQHAEKHPELARRILAEGHTVAHHTYSHKLLNKVSIAAAEAEINHGIEEDEYAVYGQRRGDPATPFFRFPGFASTPALLDRLARRGIVVFGADLWASDWDPMTPGQQFNLVMARVEHADRGILLFHDTKAQTAAMLPAFLRELKKRGYKIVHVIPAGARGVLR